MSSEVDVGCVACLQTDRPNSPLVDDRARRYTSCVGYSVFPGDAICTSCAEALDASYSFKRMAERSRAVLLRRRFDRSNEPNESPATKPSVDSEVIDVECIQELRRQTPAVDKKVAVFGLSAGLHQKLFTENRRIAINDTIIRRAGSDDYGLRVEFDEEISPDNDTLDVPINAYEQDLHNSLIKVQDFKSYVEKRILKEKKKIAIIDPDASSFQDQKSLMETINVFKREGCIEAELVESPAEFYSISEVVNEEIEKNLLNDVSTLFSKTVSAEKQPKNNENEKKNDLIMIKTLQAGEVNYNCREKLVCPVCGILTYNISAHMVSHQESKQFTCNECNKVFLQKCNLENHLKMHYGIKDNICEVCGASYMLAKSLMRHKLVHTGKKPFACDKCSMSFYVRCDLMRHLKVHAGYKPFVCTFCSTAFNAKHQLLNHVRMHTGEKPYTCKVCNLAFTYKANLNTHCLKVHNLNLKFKPIYEVTFEVLNEFNGELNQNVTPVNYKINSDL